MENEIGSLESGVAIETDLNALPLGGEGESSSDEGSSEETTTEESGTEESDTEETTTEESGTEESSTEESSTEESSEGGEGEQSGGDETQQAEGLNAALELDLDAEDLSEDAGHQSWIAKGCSNWEQFKHIADLLAKGKYTTLTFKYSDEVNSKRFYLAALGDLKERGYIDSLIPSKTKEEALLAVINDPNPRVFEDVDTETK